MKELQTLKQDPAQRAKRQESTKRSKAKNWIADKLQGSKINATANGTSACTTSIVTIKAAWEAQAGKCACCDDALESNKKAHLDHDHVTGAFRSFLCRACNTAEGLLRTAANAYAMVQYMKRHQ